MIPRHSYKGFALPKPEHKKKSVVADPHPESIVQAAVDARLSFAHMPYLRLTETLLKHIFTNPTIPVHIKKILADELGGWPDNMAFIPVSDRYCLACLIENKSDKGKLHGRQKIKAAELPYNIIRSDKEAEALIADFEHIAGLISDGIRQYQEKKEG